MENREMSTKQKEHIRIEGNQNYPSVEIGTKYLVRGLIDQAVSNMLAEAKWMIDGRDNFIYFNLSEDSEFRNYSLTEIDKEYYVKKLFELHAAIQEIGDLGITIKWDDGRLEKINYKAFFIAADSSKPLFDSYFYVIKDIEGDSADEYIESEFEIDFYRSQSQKNNFNHKLPSLPKIFNTHDAKRITWNFGKENNLTGFRNEKWNEDTEFVDRVDILNKAFKDGNFDTDHGTVKAIDGKLVFTDHNVFVGTIDTSEES